MQHRILRNSWAVLIMAAVGCKPVVLNHESTFSVPPGEGHKIVIDPVGRDQKIKVVATSADGPVNVFVYLEKDADAVKKVIRSGKITAPVLAHQLKTENTTLEVNIPANNEAAVLFELPSGKKATVTAKVTN